MNMEVKVCRTLAKFLLASFWHRTSNSRAVIWNSDLDYLEEVSLYCFVCEVAIRISKFVIDIGKQGLISVSHVTWYFLCDCHTKYILQVDEYWKYRRWKMDLSDGFLMNENCVWNVQTSSRDTFYLSVAYCQKSLFHVFFPLTFAMEMCVSCHLLAFIQYQLNVGFRPN